MTLHVLRGACANPSVFMLVAPHVLRSLHALWLSMGCEVRELRALAEAEGDREEDGTEGEAPCRTDWKPAVMRRFAWLICEGERRQSGRGIERRSGPTIP